MLWATFLSQKVWVWSLARASLNAKVKGQRSMSPGTKKALSAADTPGCVRMVCACCKQRGAAAHGPISWLPYGVFGSMRAVYVWWNICSSSYRQHCDQRKAPVFKLPFGLRTLGGPMERCVTWGSRSHMGRGNFEVTSLGRIVKYTRNFNCWIV